MLERALSHAIANNPNSLLLAERFKFLFIVGSTSIQIKVTCGLEVASSKVEKTGKISQPNLQQKALVDSGIP